MLSLLSIRIVFVSFTVTWDVLLCATANFTKFGSELRLLYRVKACFEQ